MTFKRIDECCYRGQRLYQRTIQQREEAQVTSHTTISTTVIITPISSITIITHIILTSTITITVCHQHQIKRMTQGLVEELWDLLQGLMSSARCFSLSHTVHFRLR